MLGAENEVGMRATRRRRPPLVTRDQALRVAYGLIQDEGPDGLSMRKLATGLAVSLPTVYTSIQSKDHLVADVQRQVLDEIEVAALTALRTADAPSQGQLRVMLAAVANWTISNPTLADFLLSTDLGAEARRRQATPSQTRLANVLGDLRRADCLPAAPSEAAVTLATAEVRSLMALCRDNSTSIEIGVWTDVVLASLSCGLSRLAERLAS